DTEELTVSVIGGAGNFGRAIAEATEQRHRIGGLYDEAEERFVARALNRQEGEDLTRQGFFACRPDLELELVRALGVAEMTALLEQHGNLTTFRNFQEDRKSTRLNSSHVKISYAVFCLKKKTTIPSSS